MHRRALPLGLILLVLATPAAGGDVGDMLGRRVVIATRPARIISMAPSLTEIVYALGAEARLVGVTDYCDFPPQATTKPKIGGIYGPNVEAILALKPDLVLATTEGNRAEDIHGLEALGLPVYVVQPIDFSTVLESIARVGSILGREVEADHLVARMQREAEGIAHAVAGRPRPRVLYVVWGSPLIVPGRATLITDLIRRAGGESVTGQERLPYPQFSVEEAVVRRPDLIVLARHGETPEQEPLHRWPSLAVLPAVRQGRVGSIDGNLLHKPGPRVVDGLRALARLLHPDLPW